MLSGQFFGLFDRNFAVGHFLPTLLFVVTSAYLLQQFPPSPGLQPSSYFGTNILEALTVATLLSWFGGIWLVAANYHIIRLKEGYLGFNVAWNPLRRLRKRRFRKLTEGVSNARAERDSAKAENRDRDQTFWQRKLDRCCKTLARDFPDIESLVLPFSLGNTLRAFESYPWVMYGIDAIPGWDRLIAVIPREFQEHLNSAKAQVDFLVNLWFLSHLVLVEYVVLAGQSQRWNLLWVPTLAAIGAAFASYFGRQAAGEWGELVKAAFDLYLPDLHKALRLPPRETDEQAREQWDHYCRAVIYRRRDALEEAMRPVPRFPATLPSATGQALE